MGRETRRVPPNWEHPKDDKDHYQPLYDTSYIEAITDWIKNHELWEKGEHPDQKGKDPIDCKHYAEWQGNAPSVEHYRPHWTPEDATWWQVYETVTEGTPVSPAFATQAELVDYLVSNGDFWDQKRRAEKLTSANCARWTREQAERFVCRDGWAPSGIFKDGVFAEGHRVED